ncbi:MAG: 16S rRNA (guanine(527)-N(7))-methyltransferase RsmG [Rickettsiaceae bacterium]
MFCDNIVSREVRDKLSQFCALLIKWNKVINLVSTNSLEDLERRHILDSLQLLRYIPKQKVSVVDLGSGAGFPGVVLSICGIAKVTLIESDCRKAAFLLQAAKLSSGDVEVINDRIENVANLSCDVITSRAFTDLGSIFTFAKNIQVNGKYLLHKGKSCEKEIYEARKHWLFNLQVHGSITSEEGKILEITDVAPIL